MDSGVQTAARLGSVAPPEAVVPRVGQVAAIGTQPGGTSPVGAFKRGDNVSR
jgi:hypothetical protein